jgi:hypothetical protein
VKGMKLTVERSPAMPSSYLEDGRYRFHSATTFQANVEVERAQEDAPAKIHVSWRTGTDKRASYFELALTRQNLLKMLLALEKANPRC